MFIDFVLLPNIAAVFLVSIVRVVFFLLILMFLSRVQVVLSKVKFANKVAVFCFLVPKYYMLFSTVIAICVNC
jgi:hypothetical protein